MSVIQQGTRASCSRCGWSRDFAHELPQTMDVAIRIHNAQHDEPEGARPEIKGARSAASPSRAPRNSPTITCDRCGWTHVASIMPMPAHSCANYMRRRTTETGESTRERITAHVLLIRYPDSTGAVAVEGHLRARCTSWDAAEAAARLLSLETAPAPAREAR